MFREKDNVRRIGSDKIDTVRMFRVKFGRNEPLILKSANEREPLKVVGKGGTCKEGKSD